MYKLLSFLLLAFVLGSVHAQMTPTYDNVWIPMRDGAELQADVFIPEGVDSAEVILIQTPYNKNFFSWSLPMGVGMAIDDQPFIWVVVDWRGFYGSFAAADPDADRGEDGYDICEWITEQEWHMDRIGTWGPSALGGVQYQTMRENHPNHTCAVPMVATGHQAYDEYFYGGVLEEARLAQLDALGYGLSPIVMGNTYDNIIWQLASNETWFPDIIKIPTLQIGGWYDHNIDKMMHFYTDARNLADPAVQDQQWLLVGPWVHGGTGAAYVGSADQGELTYDNAEFKSDTMAWDFMNYYLLDAANGWEETALMTYYEMGGNDQWHTSNLDDISSAEVGYLYLNNDGELGSGVGLESSTFVSNPNDPTPTIGGATLSEELDQGPYDQSALDVSEDLLVFESAPLTGDVSITGRVQLQCYIESDQPDCDIAVRLVDLYPDGRSMLITDGIKRARFRNNEYAEDDEVFMEPGEVYLLEVDLPFTNYTWLAGHAIKIYVSGNHAGRFHVNLQDGGEMYADIEGVNATITVHHSASYPSRLVLPGDNELLSTSHQSTERVNVYPNPVKEELYIENADLDEVTIYNLAGGLVQQIQDVHGVIDLSGLDKGVYLLVLTKNSGEVLTQKLVKD